ncbi:MAG: hypothetical protein HC892_23415, partial [Saprospiraceae bacterium]|nr:hypothetical protein [Saprospiraceae bacterium]
SEYPYLFGGKELNEDFGLGWYDHGARWRDPWSTLWGQVDPLADIYTSYSPYGYVLNRPLNAIDPDGKLVIFINSFTPIKSNQGSRSYWGKFASGVEKHFGENPNKSLFVHGGNELSRGLRLANGFVTGAKYADQILDIIVDENGHVTETIKIITHSMGAAFGKGFVKALSRAAKRRGVKGVPITLVADFDPFQAKGLKAEPNIFTQQFTQEGGVFEGGLMEAPWLANQRQKGADEQHDDKDESSHSISTFIDNINELKEGTYIWNGNEWELQDDKK